MTDRHETHLDDTRIAETRRGTLRHAITRRRLGALASASMLALTLGVAPAMAEYPDKPITLVVGWNAGGGTDLVARFIADTLTRETGAEVVVENRPGAGSLIATEQVANAAADGSVMMFATADSHTLAPLLRSDLGYDATTDFTPVHLTATLAFSMMARPDLEASTPQEVAEAAQAGDGLTLGTWGVGSTAHVALEMFNQATGSELIHVPYQGSAPAINDLQNGEIDLMFLGPGTAVSNVEEGTMKFIATASPERIGLAPDFATFGEQGVDGVEMQTWFGVMGPAGLPDEVVEWWTANMDDIMKRPEFLDLLRQRGMDPAGEGPEGFKAFLDEQSAALGTVVEAAGIRVE